MPVDPRKPFLADPDVAGRLARRLAHRADLGVTAQAEVACDVCGTEIPYGEEVVEGGPPQRDRRYYHEKCRPAGRQPFEEEWPGAKKWRNAGRTAQSWARPSDTAHTVVWFYTAESIKPTTEVTAEVVVSPIKRAQGLQGRERLHPATGMLFLQPGGPVERPERYHMGSVAFPIDIVFLRRTGEIGRIIHDIQPGSKGTWGYPTTAAVVELVGGFCRAHGIREGDRVGFGKVGRVAAARHTSGATATTTRRAEAFRALRCPACGTNRAVQAAGQTWGSAEMAGKMAEAGERTARCLGCGYEGSIAAFDTPLPTEYRMRAGRTAQASCPKCQSTEFSRDYGCASCGWTGHCQACGGTDSGAHGKCTSCKGTGYSTEMRKLRGLCSNCNGYGCALCGGTGEANPRQASRRTAWGETCECGHMRDQHQDRERQPGQSCLVTGCGCGGWKKAAQLEPGQAMCRSCGWFGPRDEFVDVSDYGLGDDGGMDGLPKPMCPDCGETSIKFASRRALITCGYCYSRARCEGKPYETMGDSSWKMDPGLFCCDECKQHIEGCRYCQEARGNPTFRSLDELRQQVARRAQTTCPDCDGKGYTDASYCPRRCNGEDPNCPDCDGKGYADAAYCRTCDTSGRAAQMSPIPSVPSAKPAEDSGKKKGNGEECDGCGVSAPGLLQPVTDGIYEPNPAEPGAAIQRFLCPDCMAVDLDEDDGDWGGMEEVAQMVEPPPACKACGRDATDGYEMPGQGMLCPDCSDDYVDSQGGAEPFDQEADTVDYIEEDDDPEWIEQDDHFVQYPPGEDERDAAGTSHDLLRSLTEASRKTATWTFPTYEEAFQYAQQQANATGISMGLEKPTAYEKGWNVSFLPKPANRSGWELRCQVVDPM